MAEQRPNKKVVRAQTPTADTTTGGGAGDGGRVWTPTPEGKAKATRLRIIAIVLWALAIAAEAFAIFFVLKQVPVVMWQLIVLIVVTGILAVTGSFLWKKANTFDPASRKDTVRFFVQNQLGVIISIIAFLPLIILIFTNKNMDKKQKTIAGVIGIVVALAAAALSGSYASPSQEQYAAEEGIVQDITGADEVFWTKSGSVYHLCQEASAVNKESKDGEIHVGTIAQAREAGKSRLTLQLPQELKECGYTDYQLPENWKDVVEGTAPFVPAGGDAPAPSEESTDENTDEPQPAESAS